MNDSRIALFLTAVFWLCLCIIACAALKVYGQACESTPALQELWCPVGWFEFKEEERWQ